MKWIVFVLICVFAIVMNSGDCVALPWTDNTTEGVIISSTENDATTSLLQSIMGFTRHERLDVTKPGPQPPKIENLNLEPIPEYAHVVIKHPLENWKEGLRIVQALGEMLNLQNYFTHIRVDRHAVSFRVEPNPENKTALDVAKAINESRFRNNFSRRVGVIVLKAGIGDNVKDYENDLNGTTNYSVDTEHVNVILNGTQVENETMTVWMMIMLSSALAITLCVVLLLVYRRKMRRVMQS